MASNTQLFLVAAIAVGIIIIANSASGNPDNGNGNPNPTATGATNVSQQQLAQTAGFEGFSPKAYPDGTSNGQQLYSIGYGHQIQPNEQNLMTATLTQAQGMQYLLNDMQTVVDSINNSEVQFTQGQFDAASDYGYNAGVGALANLITLFNNQGAAAVAAWLPTSRIVTSGVTSQNLINRRAAEVVTWNSGSPIATATTTASTGDDSGSDDSTDSSDLTNYFNIPAQITF